MPVMALMAGILRMNHQRLDATLQTVHYNSLIMTLIQRKNEIKHLIQKQILESKQFRPNELPQK